MGGENLRISKTIIIGHLPALPGGILGDSWKLDSAGPGGGISELDSRVPGQLWRASHTLHPQSRERATSADHGPGRGPTLSL